MTRELLTADRTYYVRNDGSDANDGLTDSAAGAWATLQHAADYILRNVDIAGYNCTVKVKPGTYAGVRCLDPFVGGWVKFEGDTTTPSNVVINANGAAAFQATFGPKIKVGGFKITNAGALQTCIYCSAFSQVWITDKMEYPAVSYAHLSTVTGLIILTASYTLNGAAPHHMRARFNGVVENANQNIVTLSGSHSYTAFARADSLGQLNVEYLTFSGSCSGKRYEADGGAIYTNGGGASYFPGSSAGTVTNSGSYL